MENKIKIKIKNEKEDKKMSSLPLSVLTPKYIYITNKYKWCSSPGSFIKTEWGLLIVVPIINTIRIHLNLIKQYWYK